MPIKKQKILQIGCIGKNDFIITNNDQKILLNGYNPNLSLTEQNDNIQFIISRYQNIVNQQIGNESLNIPSFSSKEELVNYFDYIAIVQIHEHFIRHSMVMEWEVKFLP